MYMGANNSNWKGGRAKHSKGYILVYVINHPYSHNNSILEHRYVMEKFLDRFLKSTEVVHHINGDKKDNRLKNLKLYKSAREHNRKAHGAYKLKNKKQFKLDYPDMTNPELIKKYNINIRVLRYYGKKYELSKSKLYSSRRVKILYNKGISMRQIGDKLGISRSTVWRTVNGYNKGK